jgi:hypothetical protein
VVRKWLSRPWLKASTSDFGINQPRLLSGLRSYDAFGVFRTSRTKDWRFPSIYACKLPKRGPVISKRIVRAHRQPTHSRAARSKNERASLRGAAGNQASRPSRRVPHPLGGTGSGMPAGSSTSWLGLCHCRSILR